MASFFFWLFISRQGFSVLFIHLLICPRPICIVALASTFPPPLVLGIEPRALYMVGKHSVSVL